MLFRALGFKPKVDESLRHRLPVLNSFVDMTLAKVLRPASVCVETIGASSFQTSTPPGLIAGMGAVFSYSTDKGKYRFAAKCITIKGPHATFAMPSRIEEVQKFGGQKRASVRLDTTVPGQWRFAPAGKGIGTLSKGSITDISRTGASLIIDRELHQGTQVELQVSLNTTSPMSFLGEVKRVQKIPASGKVSHGLMFHGIRPDEDKKIMEFINKRQAERRSRGLA
jgi:c-di-GMP-binding flagellar brake protein YcgR